MSDLSMFLPWTLYDLAGEAAAGRPAYKGVVGTVLFCDVAGFTPLTEALSVLGKEGAEELTRLLNGYFTRMIGIIEGEGGDVLRFGGDAMAVLFPGDSAAPALRAASKMMGAMGEFAALPTRAGTFSLSMKIGAARGEVRLGFLGDAQLGFDFYAAGDPLDGSAEAEHRARPGDVVLHPSIGAALPTGVSMENLEGGFSILREPWTGGPVGGEPPAPAPDREVLSQLVPGYLAERAGSGVLGEHRGTAVIFLGFREPERPRDDGATRHASLDAIFRAIASATRRYGGVLNKVDMGDKGCKAILLFGSPYAIEEREEMAALAALEILASPGAQGAGFRMGLTSSQLFSGPVGSPRRREFTVMGDGINLAARLMQAASPGQVLCDTAVGKGAAGVAFEELDPIRVKGKRDPVPLFKPLGKRDRDASASRESFLAEREEICEALGRYLFTGEGGPIALAAGAGLGKSALVEWVRGRARMGQIPVTRIILAPYSADRAYTVWRGTLRAVLGLQKGDGPERVRERREEVLEREPAGYRPLLNPVLELPEEVSPAIRNLSPKERKDLAFAMVQRLLAAAGERLILIDNLHWADPLSLDLLGHLLAECRGAPWKLVASLRPGHEAADGLAASMVRMEVPALTPRGTEALLRESGGLSEVPPQVLEWFGSRCRGNPALAGALLSALEREGLVVRDTGGGRVDADRLFATAFPETLEGLYMARVDRLPRREREVLQVASIQGASVSEAFLGEVSGFREGDLDEALAALRRDGFLEVDSWGDRPYLRFADSLLRDAVYASLPFARRREGHLRLAALLEPESRENPRFWPLLAQHFGEAGEEGRALHYHRLAGRGAVERSDNLTALKHLEVVCRSEPRTPEEVEDAFRLLEVYGFLGRWASAGPTLGQLRSAEGGMQPAQRARLRTFLARDHWTNSRWKEAEETLQEGLSLSESAGDISGMGKTFVNLVGGVYGPTGRLDKAGDCLERALALPTGPGQAVWRTVAAMNLGVVNWHLGKTDASEAFFTKAYREAVRGKLGPQKANIADNLCALLGEKGRFPEAVTWGTRALALTETFALRSLALSARYNLALAHLASGTLDRALDLLYHVTRGAQAQGNLQLHAAASQGLSQACVLQGDLRAALDHARTALSEFASLQNGRDFCFMLKGISGLFVALGVPGRARAFWEENSAGDFLCGQSGNLLKEVGLSRLGDWMTFALPAGKGTAETNASPEMKLESLLWEADGAAASGDMSRVAALLPQTRVAVEAWPYFDTRLRVARIEILVEGGLIPKRSQEVRHLLARGMGGVPGLRLLCLLWGGETQPQRRGALRRAGLRHLYFLHAHSPGWAWDKISAFPEVRALLKGP